MQDDFLSPESVRIAKDHFRKMVEESSEMGRLRIAGNKLANCCCLYLNTPESVEALKEWDALHQIPNSEAR